MEINGHIPSQLRATGDNGATQRTRQEGTNQPDVGRGDADDRVSLTDTAALMQRLSQRISEAPTVDQQRVDAIRQSLAAGTYQIDPSRVAEKMIAYESALAEGA